MKRTFLLFTAVAGMAYLTLSSNASGPGHSGNGNKTGSPGSSGTCASSGCHSGGSGTTTALGLDMFDMSDGGAPVQNGKYTPGHVYDVQLACQNGAYSKFGFQVVAFNSTNTSIGDLASSTTAGVDDHTLSPSLEVVEHTAPLTGSGGTLVLRFKWTAPATNQGPVTFYAIANAVNGDGSTGGDKVSTTFSRTYNDNTTSVADLSASIGITAYPVPATGSFSLKFEDAGTATYNIAVYNMNGRNMHRADAQINGNGVVPVPADGWAAGMYLVHVMQDGAQRVIPVTIQ